MEAAAKPGRAPASSPPPAFASLEPLDRAALADAPLRSLPRPSLLDAPITKLRGAGPKLAAAAAELGIETIGDALFHLPHSYRDRAEVTEAASLRIGEEATVLVEVTKAARVRPTRKRRLKIVEAEVADESGPLKAIWFNRAWLADRLTLGTRLLIQGRLEKRGFVASAQELLDRDGGDGETSARVPGRVGERPPPGLHTTGIVPIHHATEGLRPQSLREWAWQASGLARHAVEPLPARIRTRERLVAAADALVTAHFPASPEQADDARRRLAFEELFTYQVALARRRGRRRGSRGAPAPPPPGEAISDWIASLPFELTGDQRRALEEIDADLERGEPMQRLLMGEVGTGKTVIALYAMLRAIEAGHQAALMAPTETLAEQHFRTLEVLLANQSPATSFDLLTGAASAARRRELLGHLASGELDLVVGTHALLERSVEFASLAVAVVDEQHRFGVRQRAALDAKLGAGLAPHTLHMTATPIPRTLSLTAYGDLDSTALRELPAGRPPVRTWVVDEENRPAAYAFVRDRLREGRQAYVVCPLVSESDKLQARAADDEGERLAAGELADFGVEVLHGQMPSPRKQEVMERFAAGRTDVLVATSVVEVGIDVANATVMVIEAAERYGLSQLHQLRGRVGRGKHESTCIVFGDPRSEAARARLEAIASSADGFRLAEIDLGIRGEGEILGTRQHGLPRFRAALLPDDATLLFEARELVQELAGGGEGLDGPSLGPLLWEARRRFGDERRDQIAA